MFRTNEEFVAAAAESDNCENMSFLLVAISHGGLCYCYEARHPSRPTAYTHIGVHIYFSTITASEVLPPNNHFFKRPRRS